jgi:glycogen debranching enzyme
VQDYCALSAEGNDFLAIQVPRRFIGDEWIHWEDPKAFSKSSTILELVIEILMRHAAGIHFREWNAGSALDHAMTSDGFNIDAFVDWKRGGFVFGGNKWNCGTWMDKVSWISY